MRGRVFGLTRNSGPKEFARAALESVCFQTADLLEAMQADWPQAEGAETVLRVDGGMVASDWTMQRLADILAAPVDRPVVKETTAMGAAYLAGLAAGVLPPPEQFGDSWRLERASRRGWIPPRGSGNSRVGKSRCEVCSAAVEPCGNPGVVGNGVASA